MKKLEIMDNIKVKKCDNPIITSNKIIMQICLIIAGFIIFPVYIALICVLLVPFALISQIILMYKHHKQNELMKPAQSTNDETFISDKGV